MRCQILFTNHMLGNMSSVLQQELPLYGDISEKSTIDKIPKMFFQSLAHIFFVQQLE